MLGGKLTCLLVVFQIAFSGSENSFLLRLVNYGRRPNEGILDRKSGPPAPQRPAPIESECESESSTANPSPAEFVARTQLRFTDSGTNGSSEGDQMEAPAGKFSLFDFWSGGEEGQEEEEEEEDDPDGGDEEEKLKEDEEEGEADDGDDFDLLGDLGDAAANKLEGTPEESLLKQYHRQRLRMQNFVFPLLLAYKLKFFTVIPVLLGSLVLLVGTTGIAGFFFALFAAALGIHVKTHQP